MAKKLQMYQFILLAVGCLSLCACGQGKETMESSSKDSQSSQTSQSGLQVPDWENDREKYKEHFGIDIPELDPSEEEKVPENVVTVGTAFGNYMNIAGQITAFNQAQGDYELKAKPYETTDAMMLDIVRGKGCDLLVLSPSYLKTLSEKGGLEDLSPYLEKSEKVSREDLFDVILEAGTADGKLVGVLPGFTVWAILAEKGSTKDGGWTIEEYLALMDKNPDVPLDRTDPQNVVGWLTSMLYAMPESFVDWEKRSCSFESEEFIQNIKKIKTYKDRFRKTDDKLSWAELLYEGQIQTKAIELCYEEYFAGYQDIRDAFLGKYELAGYPNKEGEVVYPMEGLQSVLYCINAASGKKEAAWAFLEYMLSDYQETMADGRSTEFPARRDIVERKLQEEISAEVTEKDFRVNHYDKTIMVSKRGNFTEEDKEQVLYILDHTAVPSVLQGGTFWGILYEELGAFFAGDKTAEETARVIQSRMTVYLSE